MTTTIVHCDRCGSTIAADRHLFRVESGSLRTRSSKFDCCPSCASALLAWHPPQRPPRRPGRRSRRRPSTKRQARPFALPGPDERTSGATPDRAPTSGRIDT
jgi:hypothetical protein